MAALVTLAQGIRQYVVKNAIVIAEGNAVVYTATDDEVDLPGGTGSTVVAGCALTGGTGDANGTVKVDVMIFGGIAPMVAAAAVTAGQTVVTNSTAGKVSAATTAGAILGRAVSNASGDGKRVWVAVGRA
jgi:hypothetical protein